MLKINSIRNLTEEDKAKRGIKRTVRLLSNFPGLWQRTIQQTKNGSCQAGKTLFVADGPADLYLILNSIKYPTESKLLPKVKLPERNSVWGLHMEPPQYIARLGYNRMDEHELTSRFYTSDLSLLQQGGIYKASPPYVHFHLGKKYDFLINAPKPIKRYDLGIIVSDLTDLDGHRQRLAFLDKLDASGLNLAIWGRGDGLRKYKNYKGYILNKWDAHSICRYSVVIENCVAPYYWSEKLSDCILSQSIPFYHGCPNVENWIPENSLIKIDIAKSDVIDSIASQIYMKDDNEYIKALRNARDVILSSQNIYSFIDSELENRYDL